MAAYIAPAYRIRLQSRHEASPKPGLRQEWDEWQVVVKGRVVSRHDTLKWAAVAAQELDARPAGDERDIVTRCVDLILLDDDEVREGFHDGTHERDMDPGKNRSRAYWHGWHNAQPWNRPEPHPGVPLVQDCRAVLGDDFTSILAGIGIHRGEARGKAPSQKSGASRGHVTT